MCQCSARRECNEIWRALLSCVGTANAKLANQRTYLEGYGGLSLNGLLSKIKEKAAKARKVVVEVAEGTTAKAAAELQHAKAGQREMAQQECLAFLEECRQAWAPDRYKEAYRSAREYHAKAQEMDE